MTTAIASFNNKGGVGKTTLAYHLANMVARIGWRVLVVDLDPQANLTSAFFEEDELELFWKPESEDTILSSVDPLIRQLGDVQIPKAREVAERLWVVPGDLGLSSFEDRLSDAWPRSFLGEEGAIRVTTAFHRIIAGCASSVNADVVFLDIGPNLGAINRAALLASEALVVPLAADLFSLQGLRNLGPTLREWRHAWQTLVLPRVPATVQAPAGTMKPIGFRAPARGAARPACQGVRPMAPPNSNGVPSLSAREADPVVTSATDAYQLASLRNYRSLMPVAQDARKPMFDLRAADGALGSTARLVQTCYREFEDLAGRVMEAANIPLRIAS